MPWMLVRMKGPAPSIGIDMTLGRKVHHTIEPIPGKELLHELPVTDIAAVELDSSLIDQIGDVLEIACISQRIEHHEARVGTGAGEAHEVGANEAGRPRDEPMGHASIALLFDSSSSLACCRDSKVPASVQRPATKLYCNSPRAM